jgi:hypothetical protein
MTHTDTQLTAKEIKVLKDVCNLQMEDGLSEYNEVSSASEKGILGSLVKKGLVYDCYDGVYDGLGYMYCLTSDGIAACKELEIDTTHIHFFN